MREQTGPCPTSVCTFYHLKTRMPPGAALGSSKPGPTAIPDPDRKSRARGPDRNFASSAAAERIDQLRSGP